MIDLTTKINEYQYPQKKRSHLGASLIGQKCTRRIWYSYFHPDKQEVDPRLQRTFEIGHRLEVMLFDILADMFHVEHGTLLKCQDIPELQGTPDVILTHRKRPYIIDIKTCNSSSFSAFLSRGLINWNAGYFAQLQAYMGMHGEAKKAAILAINKDTSAVHHEWIDFNEVEYSLIKLRAKEVLGFKQPPPRLSDSPMFYLCKMCSFYKECHGL